MGRLEGKAGAAPVLQFASTETGKIFAVSWTGRFNDQINQLLGDYAADLQKYDQQHPPRSGRIHYRKVNAGRVVLEFWDLTLPYP